jgi:hypothetical protein
MIIGTISGQARATAKLSNYPHKIERIRPCFEISYNFAGNWSLFWDLLGPVLDIIQLFKTMFCKSSQNLINFLRVYLGLSLRKQKYGASISSDDNSTNKRPCSL